MNHVANVKSWNLLKGKEDAPNYRKATGPKKCGNCKAWDSSKTKDPMTGYCKMYDTEEECKLENDNVAEGFENPKSISQKMIEENCQNFYISYKINNHNPNDVFPTPGGPTKHKIGPFIF